MRDLVGQLAVGRRCLTAAAHIGQVEVEGAEAVEHGGTHLLGSAPFQCVQLGGIEPPQGGHQLPVTTDQALTALLALFLLGTLRCRSATAGPHGAPDIFMADHQLTGDVAALSAEIRNARRNSRSECCFAQVGDHLERPAGAVHPGADHGAKRLPASGLALQSAVCRRALGHSAIVAKPAGHGQSVI